MRVLHIWTQVRTQGSKNRTAENPRVCTLDSLGNGLDDLGGGALDVGEEALGAPTQNVQEPAVGLLALGDHQACKQRETAGLQVPQRPVRPSTGARCPPPGCLRPTPGTGTNWVEGSPEQDLGASAD